MNALVVSVVGVSLVTALIALALSFLLNTLKDKIGIKTRYFLWLGLLFSLLLPFRPQFGKGVVKIKPEQLDITLEETPIIADQLATRSAKPGLVEQFLDLPWLKILLVIWLGGVLVSLGIQLFRSWQFYRLLKRWSQPVEEERILASLEGTKELLALTTPVKVSHYHLTPTPMMTGFKNPHILLPTLDYTDEELDLIFEHELTHFKHHDVYVNLLVMLVTSLYWFNPLIAFIGRETQEAAESYCDHDVLANQDKAYRTFYGETIISMIGKSQQKTIGMSSCFYSNKFKLKRRMQTIVSTGVSAKWLTALAVLLVGASVLFSGSVFAMVETIPVIAQATARLSDGLDATDLRLRVADILGIPAGEMNQWKMTEDEQGYQISFSHNGQDYRYLLSKTNAKLSLVQTEDKTEKKETATSSSQTKDSSSSTKADSSKSSSASGAQSATNTETETDQEAVNSAPVATSPASAQTSADTSQVVSTPVAETQVVETYQAPAAVVQQPVVQEPVYQAPVTQTPSYTPVYSYDDDDDYDDDYDDDDDDD